VRARQWCAVSRASGSHLENRPVYRRFIFGVHARLMIDEFAHALVGTVISHFSLIHYPHIGLKKVIIHSNQDNCIGLFAREFRLGKDEAYVLEAQAEHGTMSGIERVGAGWHVGSAHVLRREDWIDSVADEAQYVGRNPRAHRWGPIGSAPPSAQCRIAVTFGIVLCSIQKDRQAIISLSDYPGLLIFTSNAIDIAKTMKYYHND
jgi:hypothetical protein